MSLTQPYKPIHVVTITHVVTINIWEKTMQPIHYQCLHFSLPFWQQRVKEILVVWKGMEWMQLVKETTVNTTKIENLLHGINFEMYNPVIEPFLVLVV